jgi:hypothetical protein
VRTTLIAHPAQHSCCLKSPRVPSASCPRCCAHPRVTQSARFVSTFHKRRSLISAGGSRRRGGPTERRSGRRALLARFQELVPYWGTDYEWRKPEAKLNALPQFTTDIDGFDIHFVDVRSRHPNALPLLIPHGWLGSFFELEKAIGPLTDPSPPGESRLADANWPLI